MKNPYLTLMSALVLVALVAGCNVEDGKKVASNNKDVEAACGDGNIDSGESCDDGNTSDGDGCSADCLSDETCGNGILDSGEACDDGNTEDGDGCSSACALPVCGDNAIDDGETCDDGNTEDGDGCSADCLSDETCGNGILDVNEECDDQNTVDDDGCHSCILGICGDGILDDVETCDDSNVVGGDGCNATCESDETCGNGFVDSELGEVCDDGDLISGDGCNATCESDETCGNGFVDVMEQCDDGNVVPGDGCDATCGHERCTYTATTLPEFLGGGYGQINFDRDCNLIVGGVNAVYLVNPATAAVTPLTTTLPATAVLGLVFDPADGIYYAAGTDRNLYAITAGGASTVLVADVRFNSLAIVPDNFGAYPGALVGVTDVSPSQVLIIDTTTGATTPLGTSTGLVADLEFGEDGRLFVMNNSEAKVQLMDSAGLVTDLVGVTGGDGLAKDPDSNRLYVADSDQNLLHVVNTVTATATAGPTFDFDSGYYVTGLLMNGDGQLIMATGENEKILQFYTPIP